MIGYFETQGTCTYFSCHVFPDLIIFVILNLIAFFQGVVHKVARPPYLLKSLTSKLENFCTTVLLELFHLM